MSDEQASQSLISRANQFAAEQVRAYLANPSAPDAREALSQAGAAFGALASQSYSLSTAFDIQKMTSATAKGLVGVVRGATLSALKAQPIVSLPIEAGSAILFDAADTFHDRQKMADDLRAERDAATELSRLQGQLSNNLEHLAYVSILTDPAQRASLNLRLSPDDLPPAVPANRHLTVTTRTEWIRDVFDEQGRLFLPQPADYDRWTSFRGWAHSVNPQLSDQVRTVTAPMFDAFERVIRP